MYELGMRDILEADLRRPVRDYITESGEWNLEAFAGKINQSALLAIWKWDWIQKWGLLCFSYLCEFTIIKIFIP